MMATDVVLSLEIGSTFTKLVAFTAARDDLRPLGRWTSRTTVADVRVGARQVLARAREAGITSVDEVRLSSSAAGGLRIAVCGLTPTLSTKIGLEVALGAGGVVVQSTSGPLEARDVAELIRGRPGLVLICGGTDGGERTTVLANVAALAKADGDPLFVFAGNRRAGAEAEELLADGGKRVVSADNVYPESGHFRFDEVRELIRVGFERDVVKAPGIAELQDEFDTGCVPTPLAVSRAVRLLGRRLGGLIAFDVGGATTDVHSYLPDQSAADILHATVEPELKRTVEGDLGVFHNLANLLDDGEPAPQPDDPVLTGDRLRRYALRAVARGLARHCGHVLHAQPGMLSGQVVYGADLRSVPAVLATGGALLHGLTDPAQLRAPVTEAAASRLAPTAVRTWLMDRHYLMSSLGTLLPERADAVGGFLDRTLEEGEWC
jgi:hypothetical protein